MPKAYPREFRDNAVAVAQRRESRVTIKQIVKEFGISTSSILSNQPQARLANAQIFGDLACRIALGHQIKGTAPELRRPCCRPNELLPDEPSPKSGVQESGSGYEV